MITLGFEYTSASGWFGRKTLHSTDSDDGSGDTVAKQQDSHTCNNGTLFVYDYFPHTARRSQNNTAFRLEA
jgi:hypothetical protein